MEKLNHQVGIAECHVSDFKDLKKNIKKNAIKIEDLKQSISSMEEKLQCIKNETINVEGGIKILIFNHLYYVFDNNMSKLFLV